MRSIAITLRDDLCRGLRVMGHRRLASVAFTVGAEVSTVRGIFWRGRDIGAKLLGGRRGLRRDNLRATDPACRSTVAATA